VGVDRRARLRDARLYFVADRGGMQHALEGALAGGVDLFQLRDKDATDDELLAAAETARDLCHAAGALFLLNDRPDLAAAGGADGVHVGQDDMPVDRTRKLVGDDAIVGLSTHSMQQAQAGCRTGADYIAVGPVHATPTKEGRPAIGVEPIKYAAAHVSVPWFAIGGLDAGNVAAVVKAGARRIVVVRAIAHADDPEAAARALRAATTSRAAGRRPSPSGRGPGWPAEVPPRG
jgi:thiamine-phosphate pyrophosphorylase